MRRICCSSQDLTCGKVLRGHRLASLPPNLAAASRSQAITASPTLRRTRLDSPTKTRFICTPNVADAGSKFSISTSRYASCPLRAVGKAWQSECAMTLAATWAWVQIIQCVFIDTFWQESGFSMLSIPIPLVRGRVVKA